MINGRWQITKEELEKEAEKYFKSICVDYIEEFERTGKRHYFVGFDIENAYLAAAEPREKRIEELEKENAELKKALEISRRCWQDQKNISLDTNCLLHKAKEILKQLVDAFPKSYSDVVKDTLEEAKKFGEK